MEIPTLRRTLASLFLLLLSAFPAAHASGINFDRDEVEQRISGMELIVDARYNKAVETHIRKFLSKEASLTRNVLYRSAIYFPIFERYLREHGMPADLKYLAVVESALNPRAISPVGAGGLWQFMSGTGRNYGLTINREVDERSCPHKSTQAAIQYLERQYERYGSWEMALAAYNCGAGNLNKAIRRAKTNDYWELSKYLPKETNNFVPAFIGVAYIATHFHLHDIIPDTPPIDLQLTEAVTVYQQLDFETIAAVTGLPVQVVATLNQAFKKNFVPASPNGHLVLLPRRVATALREFLELQRPDSNGQEAGTDMLTVPPMVDSLTYMEQENYIRTTYVVRETDNLESLANMFSCAMYNLRIWNNLEEEDLSPGQELTIWFPAETHHFLPQPGSIDVLPELRLPADAPPPLVRRVMSVPVPLAVLPTPSLTSPFDRPEPILHKALQKRQRAGLFIGYETYAATHSIEELATKFQGMTIADLYKWNGLARSSMTVHADNQPFSRKWSVTAPSADHCLQSLLEWDGRSRLPKPAENIRTFRRKI
ncbi:MAG: hypothetical protein RLY31_1567 [Bacteroidota bacterium]|jgi:membrane-bound lytic murein transglycosylase D